MLRILVVDDSSTVRLSLSQVLRGLGHETVFARSGPEALKLYQDERPDLILLDIEMPGMDGCETCKQIRAQSADRWVPIIFLSSRDSEQSIETAIEAGGDDYLTKPASTVVLSAKIRAMRRIQEMRKTMVSLTRELAEANRELTQLTTEDPLTGLGNRRLFDARLEQEMKRAVRTKQSLCLLVIDVDHFKLYNDRYGHPAGDAALREVAEALRGVCRRPADLALRYGGEEFALIFPETPRSGGIMLAKLLLRLLANRKVVHEASKTAPYLSASIGVALYDPASDVSMAELILKADEALYQAKDRGRNQCFCYDHEIQEEMMQSGNRDKELLGPFLKHAPALKAEAPGNPPSSKLKRDA
jgi:diguanylate cyclase (GGDEF)-like protein